MKAAVWAWGLALATGGAGLLPASTSLSLDGTGQIEVEVRTKAGHAYQFYTTGDPVNGTWRELGALKRGRGDPLAEILSQGTDEDARFFRVGESPVWLPETITAEDLEAFEQFAVAGLSTNATATFTPLSSNHGNFVVTDVDYSAGFAITVYVEGSYRYTVNETDFNTGTFVIENERVRIPFLGSDYTIYQFAAVTGEVVAVRVGVDMTATAPETGIGVATTTYSDGSTTVETGNL